MLHFIRPLHHTSLTALVVDRAQVIENAKQYWETHIADAIDRMTFQVGDLFTSIPKSTNGKDIYFLSAILHCVDDDSCSIILKNVASACGQTGARIALFEMVLPEVGADVASTSFDMQMFMGTRGRERTLKQWNALFDRSGLALQELVELKSFGNILVLIQKKNI